MKSSFITLYFILLSIIVCGQSKKRLHSLLWNGVQTCYSNFVEQDKQDFSIIDDTKNGYLKIFGSYPTCGCFCSATIGAYKNKKGDFTTLQTSSFTCNWSQQISSTKTLEEVLPKGFGIHEFIQDSISSKFESPIFYIDLVIPRKGTDTKMKLTLVPFGLRPKGDGLLCYSYDESNVNQKPLYKLSDLARNLKQDASLQQILSGNYDTIATADKEQLKKYIGEDGFTSIDEIRDYLLKLKAVYDVYVNITHEEITLSWNRQTSRFSVKEKSGSPKIVTFRNFLVQQRFWTALC